MTHRIGGGFAFAVTTILMACAGVAPVGAQEGVATPRTADGRPDLTGLWNGSRGFGGIGELGVVDAKGNITSTFRARKASSRPDAGPVNIERDPGLLMRADPNVPRYKPEYWDKVQHLDVNGNKLDPSFGCEPEGVPRRGPPSHIVRHGGILFFLYDDQQQWRPIYIDGRPHPPEDRWVGTNDGYAVGHWEGDTLVIESVDFNGDTWLGWPGYFHSENMKVTERLTRRGNMLDYQAIVIDPDVLTEPWAMTPRQLLLNTSPKPELPEPLPCIERDQDHMFTRERG